MGSNDNFQLTPHEVGDVTAQDIRPLGNRLSNYNAQFKGPRMSRDYTRTTFGFSEKEENPEREITDAFLAHGTDWALFEYNPYGKFNDVDGYINPNHRRLSDDWAKIVGIGEVEREDLDLVGVGDVIGGSVQYMNYPDEGYSSFGKKGDKRWSWQGNSWVPGV
jgi:hypothetical protein